MSNTENTEALRSQYRSSLDLAKNRLGWDAATLKAECSGLAEHFMGRGYSAGRAWASAASEVVGVECESLDA